MTWFEPEINLPILNKNFTFSTDTFKNVLPIRKVYFCIMYSWKFLGVDEVAYWFIKLIRNFKTPSYPLIENAVINSRFMRLSSQQWTNGNMGQSCNRLNNVWQQCNFIKKGDRGKQGLVRAVMNCWDDTSAHYGLI